MLATTNSATLIGIAAVSVTVETNDGERGDPKLVLVGLPDSAVRESIDRVQSSLSSSGFTLPRTHTTINLAPGDLRKEGASFDLPIALSLLASTKQMNGDILKEFLVAGELGLSGETRKIRGGTSIAMLAKKMNLRGVLLPVHSAREAALVEGIDVFGVHSLAEAVAFFEAPDQSNVKVTPMTKQQHSCRHDGDFSEVKGQQNLRRAVEVAVAGGHNLLIIGPPGSGKSMIAKRIPTILPSPSSDEFLEIMQIYSAAGIHDHFDPFNRSRPFRSPHHTISDVGLIGGGSHPGPGEISLAHNGVLFLDELPEFKRSALEVLRQPIEDGNVTISRSAAKVTLPCRFMLVASMNPCPCGFLGDPRNSCRCSIPQIQKYRSKISGPLLDRIDLHIEAPAIDLSELPAVTTVDSSVDVRARVECCRATQHDRFNNTSITSNAFMRKTEIEKFCKLSNEDSVLLIDAMKRLNLSARAYDRILKVSRTIADLGFSNSIKREHVLEAIQYRNLDRTNY